MAAKKNTRKKGASRNRKPAARRGTPVLAWLILLMAVALFVAFIWHVTHRTPSPAPEETTPAVEARKPDNQTKPAIGNKKDEPGKQPATTTGTTESYTFYEILPQQKVLPGQKSGHLDAPRPVTRFYLQAGAFAQEVEADKRRAEMILLGLQAQTQLGKSKDNQNLYRVMIGPYANQEEAKAALNNLKASGVETLLIKQ